VAKEAKKPKLLTLKIEGLPELVSQLQTGLRLPPASASASAQPFPASSGSSSAGEQPLATPTSSPVSANADTEPVAVPETPEVTKARRARELFSDAGSWVFALICDFITLQPEGPGQFEKDGKDATGILTALLAFVATQSGALALAEKINVTKSFALSLYLFLSLIAIAVIARLLRLSGNSGSHYFDQGTILYGKFVLYVSVIATLAFAVAYGKGWFSPSKPPFTAERINMSTPVSMQQHAILDKSLVQEIVNEDELRSLMTFTRALDVGLQQAQATGTVYISWSTARLDKDYDDFRCEVFPEVKSTSTCLAFLYASYPAKFGTTQSCLRQLYFDVLPPPSRALARTFEVKSPFAGDRVLILFWSDASFSPKQNYVLNNRTTEGAK
jgi:hypothetical protein